MRKKEKLMQDYENMSREQLMDLVKAQTEANKKKISLKVSEKGCVQLNGLRRFPIVLYRNEWETIFAMKSEIEDFIEKHQGELATK